MNEKFESRIFWFKKFIKMYFMQNFEGNSNLDSELHFELLIYGYKFYSKWAWLIFD